MKKEEKIEELTIKIVSETLKEINPLDDIYIQRIINFVFEERKKAKKELLEELELRAEHNQGYISLGVLIDFKENLK